MKVLKLRFLMDLQRLIKNIKIFLKIRKEVPIILYYNYGDGNKELINSNRELFMVILHYNHITTTYDYVMKLKLTVKYLDKSKTIDIIFNNKFLKLEDFRIGL